jgi:hypothetical protein
MGQGATVLHLVSQPLMDLWDHAACSCSIWVLRSSVSRFEALSSELVLDR